MFITNVGVHEICIIRPAGQPGILRRFEPLPQVQSMEYYIGRAVTKPCVCLPLYMYITREWVHQLQRPGAVRRRTRQWCRDTGWWAWINGGGCGSFWIDELSASTTLVSDEQFYLSRIGGCIHGRMILLATLLYPWAKTRYATDCPVGSRSKVSVWRTNVIPAGNQHGYWFDIAQIAM
jgi:hypothetical protein